MKLWLIIFDINSKASNGFAIVSAPSVAIANQTLLNQGRNYGHYNIVSCELLGPSQICQVRILNEGITSEGPQGLEGKSSIIEVSDDFILSKGKLELKKENRAIKDNTKPITSGGVYTIVGNIETLLETI